MGKNYLKEAQSKYGKELNLYTNMAAEFQNRGITYKTLSAAVEGISRYLEECAEKSEPVAITGIILASGLTKEAYAKARNGEYYHIIARVITQRNVETDEEGYGEVEGERVYLNPLFPYSAVIERAELIHEYEAEKRLSDNKRKNVVADKIEIGRASCRERV